MSTGGWNCEQEKGSTRGSFHSTIEVLEGLTEYDRAAGGVPEVAEAVARGLDYLRTAGAAPDERVAEAVEVVRRKQDAEDRWALENSHPGRSHFAIDDGDGDGEPGRAGPGRWNTLRALRVLTWYDTGMGA